jgi:hypothetical protein
LGRLHLMKKKWREIVTTRVISSEKQKKNAKISWRYNHFLFWWISFSFLSFFLKFNPNIIPILVGTDRWTEADKLHSCFYSR